MAPAKPTATETVDAEIVDATVAPESTTQAEQASSPATDADIFDVPAGDLVGGGNGGEAYKPEIGIHMATVIALCDMGQQENTVKKDGSTQRKGQVLFALNDQTIIFGEVGTKDYNDTDEPVSVISRRYTLSFNEKATLRKDFGAMGLKVDEKTTTFGSMLGAKCQLIVSEGENGYQNIQVAPPKKNQADPLKPTYLPKFWLVNSEGNPTGFRIKSHPTLVIPGERPKHGSK